MAEKTEITFGYLRKFREEHITQILKDLEEQKLALQKYIDDDVGEDAPIINGIRAGNSTIFPSAGTFANTLNNNVRAMRDQINGLIKEFETLDSQLENSHRLFDDAENDAVVTVNDLAFIIDPENAGPGGSGGEDKDEG
ncbi:hypothetical protein ACFOVU_12480 [Nocardiopsis sediminis]|uniref:Type VII secretion system-associated protein n=1 Tax=Nocardiopsis sediminis TaxID=1778267 RepID=A0ABV8FLM4_9ACTN